ncbi:MAG: DUF3783 domain-containing protein [Bacillota bacterium]|nr:DUF3783 domain-containing protein [Bacillota bacterium]
MNNNKSILIFGFTQEEGKEFEELLDENTLPTCRRIGKDMANMVLGDIIKGLTFLTASEDISDEKVILFNNLEDDELDRAIKIIRSRLTINPIMAVVTPTSVNWTFRELLTHLIEEREWFKKQHNKR